MPEQQLTHVGKYPVSRRLGRGAMGEVWLARHPELDIPVAIKTLAAHLVGKDKVFIDRFLQEARTAARISHPNVVRVYDAGTDNDVHFIVMEYVDGGTVKEMLEENSPMPPGQAIQIITAVSEGLKAAAEHSVVHRDIKPDNIMIDSKGAVKLCDLGLAKQTDNESGMTATGASFGSPAFMAPEQAINARNVDARADIYSLGATLYTMVTGEVPFPGDSAVIVMVKHMKEPLPDPRTKVADLPDNICALIRKMMAKEAAERYQSAAELLQDLHAIQSANGSTVPLLGGGEFSDSTDSSAQTLPSTPTDLPSDTTQAVGTPTRSHRKIVTIAALILALLLVAGIVLLGVLSPRRSENQHSQSFDANGTTEPANVPGVSEPDESIVQSTSLPDPELDRGDTSSIPQDVQEEGNRESQKRAEEAMRKEEKEARKEEKRAEKARRKAEERARKKKKR